MMLVAALTLSAQLDAGLATFARARPAIEQRVGYSQAVDLGVRLTDDRQYLDTAPPEGYSAVDWAETAKTIVANDVQAINDLARGNVRPLTMQQHGLYETFVRSRTDHLLIPVAVYVPTTAGKKPPLAVVLHGNPQTESEILGQPFLRRLADKTGTILLAPWGRGAYDYEGAGQNDVYDALQAAQDGFQTDPQRTYLVGYSMGGFSVFKIGPSYSHWAAVMDISGALLNSEVPTVRFAWRDTPIYVVTGKGDRSIPAIYGEQTATYLASIAIPAGLYEQMDGAHQVRTLMPALTEAWTDMHSGTIRPSAVPKNISAALGPPSLVQPSTDVKP